MLLLLYSGFSFNFYSVSCLSYPSSPKYPNYLQIFPQIWNIKQGDGMKGGCYMCIKQEEESKEILLYKKPLLDFLYNAENTKL